MAWAKKTNAIGKMLNKASKPITYNEKSIYAVGRNEEKIIDMKMISIDGIKKALKKEEDYFNAVKDEALLNENYNEASNNAAARNLLRYLQTNAEIIFSEGATEGVDKEGK